MTTYTQHNNQYDNSQDTSQQDTTLKVYSPTPRTLEEVHLFLFEAFYSDTPNAVLKAYVHDFLRQAPPPLCVPPELYTAEKLFEEEYKQWPHDENWCPTCRIRKQIHKDTIYCFLCSKPESFLLPPDNSKRCHYIYTNEDVPKHPNVCILPGSRCKKKLNPTHGKYCNEHITTSKHPNSVYVFEKEREENAYSVRTNRFIKKQQELLQAKFDNMPKFYKNLSEELEQYLTYSCSLAENELFDVREELALARAAVAPYAEDYSKLLEYSRQEVPKISNSLKELEDKEASGTPLTPEETQWKISAKKVLDTVDYKLKAASNHLTKTLKEVVSLADSASSIYLRHANIIDANLLKRAVQSIMFSIYESVGSTEGQRIEEKLKAYLNMPEEGTGISVDADDIINRMALSMGFLHSGDNGDTTNSKQDVIHVQESEVVEETEN